MEQVHDNKGIIEIDETIKKKININREIVGIVTYIFFFVIIIPVLLYKYKYYLLLEGYLPNLDLIANVLSWNGGPGNIWDNLYPSAAISTYGFISQSFVNYIALIGLTYIIAREVKLTGSIIKGWSIGFVMLLMTYLLPSNLVTHLMNLLKNYFNNLLFPAIIGLIVSILIIVFESLIIKNSRKTLLNIGKTIINFPNFF